LITPYLTIPRTCKKWLAGKKNPVTRKQVPRRKKKKQQGGDLDGELNGGDQVGGGYKKETSGGQLGKKNGCKERRQDGHSTIQSKACG